MRYSLINVSKQRGEIVEGIWLQNCTGDLHEAVKCARDTEKANSRRITVAVVEEINGTTLIGVYRKGMKRLDI